MLMHVIVELAAPLATRGALLTRAPPAAIVEVRMLRVELEVLLIAEAVLLI